MKRKAKVMFAELSFDALPLSETSDVFERVEHDGLNGSRQVTFVYDDFDCPCRSNLQGGSFKVFEEYFRNELEGKFVSEILRLESLGSFPRLSFSLGGVKAGCGNTEVSREMIGELADRGMSFRMSLASKSRDCEEILEFPASLISFLAKYHFSIAF